MKVKSYKELNIWKKGIEIAERVYVITENFPRTELYGLSLQMQRSAISIPSNIAEGFARGHTAEYKQFPAYSFKFLCRTRYSVDNCS